MNITKEELEWVSKTFIDVFEEAFTIGKAGRENYRRLRGLHRKVSEE